MKKRHIYVLLAFVGIIAMIAMRIMLLDDSESQDSSMDGDVDRLPNPRPTLDLISVVDANRDIWDSHNISDYQMSIHMFAPPVLPIGVDLTIGNGRITESSIIACDNPTEWHHEDFCEPTRTHYADWGHFTIIDLFAEAEHCMRRTEEVLNSCTDFDTTNFVGFSDLEEIGAATELCQNNMVEQTDWLCLVQFHEDFGYPFRISTRKPNVADGGSDFLVQDFEILD